MLAIGCAIAATILGAYTIGLVYAAATFEHDSLPGPTVLGMVAIVVGLATILFAGVARLLWRAGRNQASTKP